MRAILFIPIAAIIVTACQITNARRHSPADYTSGSVGNRTLIGDATMDEAGVIHVWLRAEDGKRTHGDAFFEVKPGSAEYPQWIQHLGGLKPGQSKGIPAWPSSPKQPNKAPEPTPTAVTPRAIE